MTNDKPTTPTTPARWLELARKLRMHADWLRSHIAAFISGDVEREAADVLEAQAARLGWNGESMIDQHTKLSKRLRERGELLDLYHSIIGGELDREAADVLDAQAAELATANQRIQNLLTLPTQQTVELTAIRKALEPVGDWYDAVGNDLPLVEVVANAVVSMEAAADAYVRGRNDQAKAITDADHSWKFRANAEESLRIIAEQLAIGAQEREAKSKASEADVRNRLHDALAGRAVNLEQFVEKFDAQAAEIEKLRATIDEQKAEIERLQATLDDRTLQHRVQLENAQRLQAELEKLRADTEREVERITALWRFQVADSERLRSELAKDRIEMSSRGSVKWTLRVMAKLLGRDETIRRLQAEVERLKAVMAEVGSLAGRDWLVGQLKLAEVLNPTTPDPQTTETEAGCNITAGTQEPKPAEPPPAPVCARCGLPGKRYRLLDIGTGSVCHAELWQCDKEREPAEPPLAPIESHEQHTERLRRELGLQDDPPPAPDRCPLCDRVCITRYCHRECPDCGLLQSRWPQISELVRAKAAEETK